MTAKTSDHIIVGSAYILAAVLALGLLISIAIKSPAPSPHSPHFVAIRGHHRGAPPPPPYQFPGGGRELAGIYRMVALYGVTDSNALGALGDQPLDAGIARVKQIAAEYQAYTKEKMYPAFEIIATIASSGPTENGDYSEEVNQAVIRPWIDAAKRDGVYVLLDLQPGRTDFLTQAKAYESLLAEPHVGLALDPEWRLGPDQVHLAQIGSVGVDEVNATSEWLSGLVKRRALPQKLFLLHQFRTDMIVGRERLTQHPELFTVVQMDGQGSQAAKADTWSAMTAAPPPGVQFGWKNFYDEDQPILSPEETMQRVPQPWYVSYQ